MTEESNQSYKYQLRDFGHLFYIRNDTGILLVFLVLSFQDILRSSHFNYNLRIPSSRYSINQEYQIVKCSGTEIKSCLAAIMLLVIRRKCKFCLQYMCQEYMCFFSEAAIIHLSVFKINSGTQISITSSNLRKEGKTKFLGI